MDYEVIVVGGGIGGLTAAALLAARGVKVCLIEKEPHGGGCAVAFPRSGYDFEAGPSLYASWQPGEIHDRVFAELPVNAPDVREALPAYVVRLPDGTDVPVTKGEEFEETLSLAFPECAQAAIDFYREMAIIGDALRRVNRRLPDLRTASKFRQTLAALPELRVATWVLFSMNQTAGQRMARVSERFKRFVDVQLQIFGQRPSDECAYLYAAVALTLPRTGMFTIHGGASGLAQALTQSFKESGGHLRFNSTALRIDIDSTGRARSVVLLSGERVAASKAIVSNLPVWDTYGKLLGTDQTPANLKKRLKRVSGWGSYVLYLGLDEEVAARLPAEHILTLCDWQNGRPYDPEEQQFMFGVAPSWDPRAPAGKRAVTVSTFTEASQWFAYHESEEAHEKQDQDALERWWEKIHRALPEVDGGLEVIETATPRSFYDYTRRKLGMVGGVGQSLDVFGMRSFSHLSPIPNLFLVGDTVFPGQGVAAVTQSGLIVANELTR